MTEIQKKKNYLLRYHSISLEIEQLKFSLERLQDKAERTTSILRDMPRGGKVEDMSDLIAKKIELEKYVKEMLLAALETRIEIENVIKLISNPEYRAILRYKYIENMTFEEIAEKTMYSNRNIYYMHDKAIKSLAI